MNYTNEDKELVLKMKLSGKRNIDISNTLGISEATVSRWLVAKGIRAIKERSFVRSRRVRNIYRAMVQRCYSVSYKGYKYYGGKGIGISKDWLDSVVAFEDWSFDNGYTDELTIDRINEALGYSPDNCQWITQHEQVLKQKRNKDRDETDKYISITSKGRYYVSIISGATGNRKLLFSKTCITKDEAIQHRDHFLSTGEKLEFDNGYAPKLSSKKKELLRATARENKRAIKKLSLSCYAI